jgi:DNA helicase-2/ATP-dependent DNA helicase PcrA
MNDDISHIIDGLNDAQREAVCAPAGNTLVLAGAGSGKTRVLVHRIAWLIQVENISPFGILAVTFTNKASAEMRHRIEQLMGVPVTGMWVGTFHNLAHRLLRTHWKDAQLPQNFQILDSDDQLRAIKRIIREQGIDDNQWQPKQMQWFINARKDEGQRPQHLEHHGDHYVKGCIHIYQSYEDTCRRAGLVDFAELLLRAHELWRDNPHILQHYQARFKHVLVDEFQDTNAIQYAWLRMLCGNVNPIFAVGDDDQSIYGWRGAKVENIHQLSREFKNTLTVRLEQNYRSTGNILAAANALISNNSDRLGKELWTSGSEGEPLKVYNAFNEIDEARFIANRIRQWVEDGNRRSDAALLYRSNAQSRVLEEALLQSGIPYRVYGGLRFFDRAEIKDALAYLRLCNNRLDDASFERIINTPTRGIGDKAVSNIREYARAQGITLWQAITQLVEGEQLTARSRNAFMGFIHLIETLTQEINKLDELHEQVDHVVMHSGLIDHFRKEKGEKGQQRIDNLEELVSAAREFEFSEEEMEMDHLSAFLSLAALESGESQGDPGEDCVQLMTLHSAKGLEFPLVFLCGMEDGLFPHKMSASEPGRIEEERRLCYVGITRAMQELYLTHAESRRLHGKEEYAAPSRFLKELPTELIQEVRLRSQVRIPEPRQRFAASLETEAPAFALGQRVHHAKFGEGVVLQCEGNGGNARIQVEFMDHGSKWLIMSYANLQVI